MKRKKMLIATTTLFSIMLATTAFAGTWQTGKGADQNKWWYDNEDGTYAQNSWQWIDGNGDGIAESYCFDANGWLLVGTTTPDGYKVNESGAWVENGVVQTKIVSKSINVAPISENDFIVSGNNSVTRNTSDSSIITNWIKTGYSADPTPYHTFVTGDSLTTARGISLGNTKSDVVEKYGNMASQNYNSASDKWYQFMIAAGNSDAPIIAATSSVIEYSTNPYGIRFHFNQQDILTGIMFFRDATVANTSGIEIKDNTQTEESNSVGDISKLDGEYLPKGDIDSSGKYTEFGEDDDVEMVRFSIQTIDEKTILLEYDSGSQLEYYVWNGSKYVPDNADKEHYYDEIYKYGDDIVVYRSEKSPFDGTVYEYRTVYS